MVPRIGVCMVVQLMHLRYFSNNGAQQKVCYNTHIDNKEKTMNGAYFYIEYRDGSVTQVEFKTAASAKKAYQLYEREPEVNARCWGWEVRCDPLTLSQQIRTKKAMA
jgi:hypothetical protein